MITYTVTVANTGNVTLKNVVVSDSLISPLPAPTGDNAPVGELNVGETWTYTYSHTITQNDMDTESVQNTFTAESAQTDPVSDSKTLTFTENPAMTVTKNADKSSFSAVGDVITYTLTVENTGNVTLKNVVVSDSLVSPLPAPTGDNDPVGELNVGETWTYTYTYTVTQADMEKGVVKNVVKASNPDIPEDDPDAPTDEVEVPADPMPAMTLKKTADKNEFTRAGDVITYTIKVKNTGNVTLKNVVVSDSLVTLTNAMRTESKTADGELEVGETWTYKYTYTVTQADMDKGFVKNVAKASNPDIPVNDPDAPSDEIEIPGRQKPRMTVIKTADKAKFTAVGNVINYTVTVTNTGNVTLKDVVVSDSLVPLTDAMRTESKTRDGILEVGETWTYKYTYTVTQDDLDKGFVKNAVKATNPDIPDDPNNPPPGDEVNVTYNQKPAIKPEVIKNPSSGITTTINVGDCYE